MPLNLRQRTCIFEILDRKQTFFHRQANYEQIMKKITTIFAILAFCFFSFTASAFSPFPPLASNHFLSAFAHLKTQKKDNPKNCVNVPVVSNVVTITVFNCAETVVENSKKELGVRN